MTPHGGDVWQVAEALGIPAAEILDFSANINPRGLPPAARDRLARDARDPLLLSRYPDPSAAALRRALSDHLSIPADAIVVGPGAEALLAPILRSLHAHHALVPVPAFSEYRRVCAQQQIACTPFPLHASDHFRVHPARFSEMIEHDRPDVILLNNPHNPSGAMLGRDELAPIVDAAHAALATLVLDEAFIDYAPHASLAREAAAQPGLIVLRSLTKFYGCPALRVGYAIAHPETVRRIRALSSTWPVTQLALDALTAALADRDYAAASLLENQTARDRLSPDLQSLGLTVFPSAANYLLVELNDAMLSSADLRALLIARHRILIRNCDSYETLPPKRYIRVAVRTPQQNARLITALGNILVSKPLS